MDSDNPRVCRRVFLSSSLTNRSLMTDSNRRGQFTKLLHDLYANQAVFYVVLLLALYTVYNDDSTLFYLHSS